MAVGRKLFIKKNDVNLIGVRSATISWSAGSINLTSGEDNGIRLLDADSAEQQIDVSGEGIIKDAVLRALALSGGSTMLTDITIEFPILNPANTTKAELSGDFKLASFEESAPYNDAITFSFTLESSGPWVYTSEAA